jgi:hypothetical protein
MWQHRSQLVSNFLSNYFFRTGGLTLEEVLHMEYEKDLDVDQVHIEPPDAGTVTDQDFTEEDEGELIDNFM